jgi:ABC-type phosphate/phosphonate transport system ATPase subunit
VIELLGVGVSDGAAGWLFQRVCARIGPGVLTLVVSRRPQPRLALLDAVAGRRVPQEGRIWVNGAPVSRDTVSRVRARVAEVNFTRPLLDHRSLLWNTLAVAPRGLRTVRGCLCLPRPAARWAAQWALEAVELGANVRLPVASLGARERLRLRVARALVGRPECVLAREVDTVLSAEGAETVLSLLRTIARRLSIVALASVDDEWLAWRPGDRVVALDDGASVVGAQARGPVGRPRGWWRPEAEGS